MKSVRITGIPGASHVETYTLTFTSGEDESTMSFPEGHFFDVTIPCDTLTINRTGTFSEVTVNPDPFAKVCLTSSQPLVFVEPDHSADLLVLGCVALWCFLFYKMLS